MDAEQAAFLRAIAENPDDDTARLVFADWLDERTSGRGDLIRLDLHLATLPKYTSEYESLLARRAELLPAHLEYWRSELPAFPGVEYTAEFDRGLPSVTVTWDALCACGHDLFAAVPIRRVCLQLLTDQADLAALAGLGPDSWLGSVREINAKPSNDAVAALAACPALANLTALRFRVWAGLDSCGIRPLTESPHLGRLEHLELSGHDIGNEEAVLVAGSQTLTRLISYTSCGVQMPAASVVGAYGVEAFADAPVVRLRKLRLPGHSCDHFATEALARGPATDGLEVLDLSYNRPGDAGVERLLQAPWPTNLRELNLRSTHLTDRGVRALADSPLLGNLRRLDVAENAFTDVGATALALSEHLPDDCRVTVGWYSQFRRVSDRGLGTLRERFPNLDVVEL